ncbi:MAG: hypothetical protein ABI301_02460, partial [Jatrophihabitantaceae bacterium]
AGGGGQRATPDFTTNGTSSVSLADGRRAEKAPWSVPDRTGEHLVLCADVIPATGHIPASMRLRAIGDAGDVHDEITLVRGAVAESSSNADDWLLGGGALLAAGVVGAGAVALGRRRRTSVPPAEASGAPPPDGAG